ncbi:hypothetical protein [Nocardioides sp. NPDC006303]|uniref:hypothetical protein n=1 Tax=Nocardioides sp. NPDC006303 TaxID=3156747 RepID=UPI0033A9DD8C
MTDHDDYGDDQADRMRELEQRFNDQERALSDLLDTMATDAAPGLVAHAEDLLTRPRKQRAIDELARRGVLNPQPCGCRALDVPSDESGEPDYSRATVQHRAGCPLG